MNIIVHIGLPKCGSSSIQKILSSDDFLKNTIKKYVYVSIDSNGDILYGKDLVAQAAKSKYGYISSVNGNYLRQLSYEKKNALNLKLRKISKENGTIILSNEGWGFFPEFFNNNKFLFSGFEKVDVIGFVRPQLEWLNAAWWQWGAWTNLGLEQWVSKNKDKVKWFHLFQRISSNEIVSSVTLIPLSKNLILDFFNFLNIKVENTPKYDGLNFNKGLPGIVLRLYQYDRSLRRDPHDSSIDFSLMRNFDFKQETPWVITKSIGSTLVDYFRHDNSNLINVVSKSELILNNNRWWHYKSFETFKIEPEIELNFVKDELIRLCVDSLKIINKLDTEILTLK